MGEALFTKAECIASGDVLLAAAMELQVGFSRGDFYHPTDGNCHIDAMVHVAATKGLRVAYVMEGEDPQRSEVLGYIIANTEHYAAITRRGASEIWFVTGLAI
jgi:hypothetical protein